MRTLITNGTVVNADGSYRADVLVDGETIAGRRRPAAGWPAASRRLTGSGVDRRIDATGKYVIPGAIDVHTHMELPFGGTFAKDTFETGTRAAAFGGTTTIVDFAVQSRGKSLREGLDAWHAKAEGNAVIDYGFHMIMSDVNDDTLAEMDQLVDRGRHRLQALHGLPRRLLQRRRRHLPGHAADREERRPDPDARRERPGHRRRRAQTSSTPGTTDPIGHGLARYPIFEGEATNRVIRLAEAAGVPVYIVHLSARDALEERPRGARSRRQGLRRDLPAVPLPVARRPGQRVRRRQVRLLAAAPDPADHQDELWIGLVKDDLQVVSTDHCPFDFHGQKQLGRGRLPQDPQRPAGRRGSPRPDARRRRRRRPDQQGALGRDLLGRAGAAVRAGAARASWRPAPMPTSSSTTRTASTPSRPRPPHDVDYSCYEGREVTGGSDVVLSRGEVVVEDGEWKGTAGRGRFLKRTPTGGALR